MIAAELANARDPRLDQHFEGVFAPVRKVGVGVPQAGDEKLPGTVDHLGTGGDDVAPVCVDCLDAIAAHDNRRRCNRCVGNTVDQRHVGDHQRIALGHAASKGLKREREDEGAESRSHGG